MSTSTSATPTAAAATAPAAGTPPAAAPAAAEPATPASIPCTLTAVNASTVPGNQYFNVYPPLCTVSPSLPQTLVPLVSLATRTGTSSNTASIAWSSGPGALAVVVPYTDKTPLTLSAVTPGSTVTVSFANGTYSLAVAPGSGGTGVTVVFATGTPVPSSIGLVAGPGTNVIALTPTSTTVTLTPNLTAPVTVQFGTPYQAGAKTTDLGQAAKVTLVGTTSMTAAIQVGVDNLIVQTA